ncbi:MAG TPA: phosphate ABC transporter permease PstA [Actinomycetes bacterium]
MALSTAGPTSSLHQTLTGGKLPGWAPWVCAAGSVLAAVALIAVLPVNGRAQTIILAVLLFVGSQTAWSFAVEGRRHAVDRLVTTLIYSAGVIALVPLVAILATVIIKGLKVFSGYFLLHSMRNVSPLHPGGGVYHAIIGTLEVVGIAAIIGIPIGALVAIYLVEYGAGKRLAYWVTFFVDVMTGIPSIVAGLFVYTGLILTLGWQRTGFTGALSLTILMIPVMVRSTEEMLKLVPNELRESAYALGVPKYKTILRVVVPTALSGIITGAMLAVARITGETAPLLLTMFISASINFSPFTDPQATLPTFIWDQIARGTPASLDRAWAAALTLILIVVLLNLMARLLGRVYRVK